MTACQLGSSVNIASLAVIKCGHRVEDITKSLSARLQLNYGIEGVEFTALVILDEAPAPTRVVRLLRHVFEAVRLAHDRVEGDDVEVFYGAAPVAVALAPLDAYVERIEVTVVGRGQLDHVGVWHVPEQGSGLDPHLRSASRAPPILMRSVACLDLVHRPARVGATPRSVERGLVGIISSHLLGTRYFVRTPRPTDIRIPASCRCLKLRRLRFINCEYWFE